MLNSHTFTLTWLPGSMDHVRFTYKGQQFTVRLKDVQRINMHSLDALYLRGRVKLPVTRAHLHLLMQRPQAAAPAEARWENEGGAGSPDPAV